MNLGDNFISDYGMNAIKNIISNCSIVELNLSSNLISKSGLELIADDLIRNTLITLIWSLEMRPTFSKRNRLLLFLLSYPELDTVSDSLEHWTVLKPTASYLKDYLDPSEKSQQQQS